MTETGAPWVLCVDDEPRVLNALSLTLGLDFDVEVADSGEDALELLAKRADCGVVVSDMRMPGMDGAELLAEVRRRHPATMRVLLTGHAEVASAIAAINHGRIFRFLTKPASDEELQATVAEAMELYRLRTAERDLLERTVTGVVQALVEVMTLALPHGLSRATATRDALRRLRGDLGLEASWELETAAMLARVGWLAVPDETLQQYLLGEPLDGVGRQQMERAVLTTTAVIGHIPRFERVTSLLQDVARAERSAPADATGDVAQLQAVLTLEELLLSGVNRTDAVERMRRLSFDPHVLDLLGHQHTDRKAALLQCAVRELLPGYVVAKDVVTASGMPLVRSGAVLTPVLIERLRNFHHSGAFDGQLRVWNTQPD
ncbi:MAG: response regulator [Acidimicrobiales bacterium]